MIKWDENKNIKLKLERNISFDEIAEIILEQKYLDILDHPTRKNQQVFVIELNDYIHIIPFVIDKDNNIFLKTAFPSRKLNKKYRGKL